MAVAKGKIKKKLGLMGYFHSDLGEATRKIRNEFHSTEKGRTLLATLRRTSVGDNLSAKNRAIEQYNKALRSHYQKRGIPV